MDIGLKYIAVPKAMNTPARVRRPRGPASEAESVAAAAGEKFDWVGLVLSTWRLPDTMQHRGRLPAGMAQQVFRAMVQRAAMRLGGTVGIATRGEDWWVWTRRRGRMLRQDGHGIRGPHTRWDHVRAALVKADGEPIQIEGVLTADDQKRLEDAARRWGMTIVMEVRGECTVVQQVGEV